MGFLASEATAKAFEKFSKEKEFHRNQIERVSVYIGILSFINNEEGDFDEDDPDARPTPDEIITEIERQSYLNQKNLEARDRDMKIALKALTWELTK